MAKKTVEVAEVVGTATEVKATPVPTVIPESNVGASELAKALTEAINAAKPPEKKTPFNRKAQTPWTPKNGEPKAKLRRTMYQHGLLMNPDTVDNETIELLNKLKPGRFLDNFVTVTRRKDYGLDIDYPIRTASQRLKLVNQYRIRDLKELLARCIDEVNDPQKYPQPDKDRD
jgi:hypothetical protein